MGMAQEDIDFVSAPVCIATPTMLPVSDPSSLIADPLARMRTAEMERWRAKQVVLDKAWRPHLWLNSSVWGQGGG